MAGGMPAMRTRAASPTRRSHHPGLRHGNEREAAWQTLTAGIPRFGRYAEKTDREIPVIRLTPRSS
jgi:F420H(2)-dependent quinone reductase